MLFSCWSPAEQHAVEQLTSSWPAVVAAHWQSAPPLLIRCWPTVHQHAVQLLTSSRRPLMFAQQLTSMLDENEHVHSFTSMLSSTGPAMQCWWNADEKRTHCIQSQHSHPPAWTSTVHWFYCETKKHAFYGPAFYSFMYLYYLHVGLYFVTLIIFIIVLYN